MSVTHFVAKAHTMIAKPKFNMFSFSSLVLFGFGIAVMIAICSLVKTPFLNIRPAEIEWNAPLVEGFELAGMRAVVLKYSGTDAQFWIEKESDGVVTKFGDHDWQLDPRPKQNEVIQGVFIWIRGEHDATGMEKWSVSWHRYFGKSGTGIKVSVPSIMNFSSDISQSHHRVSRLESMVSVWNENPTSLSRISDGLLSSNLPPTGEIKVFEISETGGFELINRDDSSDTESDEKLKQTDKKQKREEKHVIRVMGKRL